MSSGQSLALSSSFVAVGAPASSAWSLRLWRALILCSLFSIIFLPEFRRDGDATLAIYTKAVAGFRWIDLLLLSLVLGHVVALGCQREKRVHFPKPLAVPGCGFLVCVAVAIWYGSRHGGGNFFFDWRGLALGMGLYFVWSYWMQDPSAVADATRIFLAYAALRLVILYGLYLTGHRDSLADVAIPIFDGPIVSCIVYLALLAFQQQEAARRQSGRFAFAALSLAGCLYVLLCFRRTYWGELGVGLLILLWLKRRNRLRSAFLFVVVISIAALAMGGAFSNRLRSLDVTSEESQFSADNANHVYDLVDAWDQVRQSPLMGIGLGSSYQTWHIRNWKSESVMVHNAPLHVWLKYGVAGLVFYICFHIALLFWLYRRAKLASAPQKTILNASLAYLTAQFVTTLGFAPWPYSELQLTTLISFLLAGAVMSAGESGSHHHESSLTFGNYAGI